jgi:S1-C subfamily serine protease
MRQHMVIPVALACAALIGAAVGVVSWRAASDNGSPSASVSSPLAQPTAATQRLTLEELYRRTAPGVVELTVRQTTQDSFGFSQETGATGSGFVIDGQGHIVTNYHVVQGAATVTVRFADGSQAQATVVGSGHRRPRARRKP